MPWNLRRDLHLDINAGYGRVLLTSAIESSLLQPPPDFVAGDGMPVRLYFWERGLNGTLTAADPGPDTSLILTGRPDWVPPGSDLLFLTNDFVEIETGVWEGTLDLTPAEFAAHLAADPVGAKLIRGEVEVRDSVSNTKRISFQFDLTARPDVYQNDDTPLGLPTPEAWLLGNTTPTNAGVTISGSLTSDGITPYIFPFLPLDGLNDGRANYLAPDASRCYWGTGVSLWTLISGDEVTVFTSSADVATPDLVPAGAYDLGLNPDGWQAMTGSGIPVATLQAATAAPPFLRVADGFLYIQEAGVWKKTALSNL